MDVSDLLGCVKSSSFVESDAILEALTLLQQPTVYNLQQEIDSSNLADLRLPSERLPWFRSPFTWKLPKSTTSVTSSLTASTSVVFLPTTSAVGTPLGVYEELNLSKIPANSNRVVVKSSDTLHTAAELPIPSCLRVQINTKSTVNRKVTVGLLILPFDQDSHETLRSPRKLHRSQNQVKTPQRCGVQIENATLSKFPTYSNSSWTHCGIEVSCQVKSGVHTHGAVIAQIPLSTESCCYYLLQFGQSRETEQQSSSRGMKIIDKNMDDKNVYIQVVLEEIENTATVSVKEDSARASVKILVRR